VVAGCCEGEKVGRTVETVIGLSSRKTDCPGEEFPDSLHRTIPKDEDNGEMTVTPLSSSRMKLWGELVYLAGDQIVVNKHEHWLYAGCHPA